MNKLIRSQIVLAATMLLAGVFCFAQDGAATYKAKCAMCHGPTGTPSAGMGKAMGIKPVSDPSMQALTVTQIEAAVKEGKGKMKPVASVTGPAVDNVVAYVKSLKK